VHWQRTWHRFGDRNAVIVSKIDRDDFEWFAVITCASEAAHRRSRSASCATWTFAYSQ
jgi:hypothetical protein